MRRSSVFILLCSIIFAGCSALGGKQSGLKITANIPATILLDEKTVGSTPFQSSDLKAKKYSVKITPADSTYALHQTSIKLFGGYMSQIDWNFAQNDDESSGFAFEYEDARDKSKSELQLVADPDNVPVIIDGKNVGFTPLLLDTLTEGDHSVQLGAPGYEDTSRTVRLVKGVRILMTSKLAKKMPVFATPTPVASDSAQATASPSASKKPTPTPKATVKPTASASAKPSSSPSPKPSVSPSPTPTSASSSGILHPTTSTKPYVEILSTTTGWLRVRESAGTSSTSNTSKELTKLEVGSTVPYAGASSSGWLKVTYQGTSTGWVSGDYVKLVQ